MAGLFGPFEFLGDEALSAAGDTAIKELPQNQLIKKTAEIANDALVDGLEKIPILGDAIKVGVKKYNWTNEQIKTIIHGTGDDIKNMFGDDAVPDNAVDNMEDHAFTEEKSNSYTKEQIEAEEAIRAKDLAEGTKSLNEITGKARKTFSDFMTEHNNVWKKVMWEKLRSGIVNKEDSEFLNSFKLNNNGHVNATAFARRPEADRMRFFDIIENDESGFDINTRNIILKKLKRPQPIKIRNLKKLEREFGGFGDFEMKKLGKKQSSSIPSSGLPSDFEAFGEDLPQEQIKSQIEGERVRQARQEELEEKKLEELRKQRTTTTIPDPKPEQPEIKTKQSDLPSKLAKTDKPDEPVPASVSTEPVPDLKKLVDTLDENEKQYAQSEDDYIREKFGDKLDKTPMKEITDAIDEREKALLNKNIDPDADFTKIKEPIKPGIQQDIPPGGTPKGPRKLGEEPRRIGTQKDLPKQGIEPKGPRKLGEEPRRIGTQKDLPPAEAEEDQKFGGLTKKELAIGGGAGVVGAVVGSGHIKKLLDILPGLGDRHGIPGEIQKIIKKILQGPDSPEKKKIVGSLDDIIDNEKNIDKSDQGAKVDLKIFNQPSVSQVENNQNKSNLDNSEARSEKLRQDLRYRIKGLSKQATFANTKFESKRLRKKQLNEIKRREKKIQQDERRVLERFDRLPSQLAGIIRPSLAGDSMKKPVNVNIVNKVQSPTSVDGRNLKVNEGVLQKGYGYENRTKPQKQRSIRKIGEMSSNEFLMKKNEGLLSGVLREKN